MVPHNYIILINVTYIIDIIISYNSRNNLVQANAKLVAKYRESGTVLPFIVGPLVPENNNIKDTFEVQLIHWKFQLYIYI